MDKRGEARTNPVLRTILFLFGSFTFTWCLALLVHESGHALAYWLGGVPMTRFCVNPFGLSFIWSSRSPGPLLWFVAIMGPLIGLAVAGLVYLAVRRRCRAVFFSLALWLGIAMYQEGGGALIGLLAGPQSMEDWGYLTRIGVPVPVTAALAVLLLAGSFAFILSAMPGAGLHPDRGAGRSFGVLLAAFMPYFLISVVYEAVMKTSPVAKKLIPLGGAVVLAAFLAFVYKPLERPLQKLRDCPAATISWPAVVLALCLGFGIILLEYLLFVAS